MSSDVAALKREIATLKRANAKLMKSTDELAAQLAVADSIIEIMMEYKDMKALLDGMTAKASELLSRDIPRFRT